MDDTDIDLDLEALERALEPGGGRLAGSIASGPAPRHGEPMGPELTEALPSSPGRPSESYEPQFPNWAVDGSNARKMPGSGLACVTCPEAVWMSGGEDLQAFCRLLRAITWSARETGPMQIEICNGKELAIVAMLETQGPNGIREQPPSGL